MLKLSSLLTLAAGIGEVPGYPLDSSDMFSLARQAGFPENGLDEELNKVGVMTKEQFVTEVALYS